MAGTTHDDEPIRSALPLVDMSPLDEAIRSGGGALKAALKRFRPADVGRDLSRRPIEEGKQILASRADDRWAAAMLRAAHPSIAAELLAMLDPSDSGRMLAFLTTDHQVAILGAISDEDRARIEGAMPEEDHKLVERLLSHPEGVVGRLMTTKVWACEADLTAGQAIDALRSGGEEIEIAQNCYVTREGRLVGVIPLRELAVAPKERVLRDAMTPDPIAVDETTTRGDAAEIIQTHDFLSLPVVDRDGRLIGGVRVDDLLEAALSKVGFGILNQGGVSGKVAAQLPYFQTPLSRVVRTRITWLVLLFVAETLTGTVLRHFEDELAKVVALSFFIPLLIGTGGNAGSQTVSTIIRAIALGEVRLRDWMRVLVKEVSAGLVLGVLLGLVAYGRAMLWGVSADLAGCVAVTVLVVCTWANTVGAVIPITAQRIGIDPTVVSGPLITTLVDASGLFIYLTVAQLMVAQLHG